MKERSLLNRLAPVFLLQLLLIIFLPLVGQPTVAGEAPESPRIVTLAPGLTELVYAAGAGAMLVGTVAYSDYPPEAELLPRIGDAFRIDYEALRRLNPSLVITWESGTPRAIVERLQQLDFNVVEFDPRDLDAIADDVEAIGALAGTQQHSGPAAERLRASVAELRALYAGRERVSVFYQISANPWFTVNGEHVISEVLATCGGDNVFSDVPGVAPPVSLEAILRADPQVVIAGTRAAGWKEHWAQWSFLQAVQRGAMYSVDPDLVTRATPRLVQGAVQICAALDDARSLMRRAEN